MDKTDILNAMTHMIIRTAGEIIRHKDEILAFFRRLEEKYGNDGEPPLTIFAEIVDFVEDLVFDSSYWAEQQQLMKAAVELDPQDFREVYKAIARIHSKEFQKIIQIVVEQ